MLILSKKHADELVKISKEGAPNEVCGILAGRSAREEAVLGQGASALSSAAREAVKIYPMSNTDDSSQSFLMDPKEQLKAMKDMRNAGLEMVGIYHSHPETRAYPSQHDISMAYYPDASYVIVSLADNSRPDIRSFTITDGAVAEEEIKTS